MLILVTGGSRSGKSGLALALAKRFSGPRVFLATAQAADEEMRQRIEAHRTARSPDWSVVEEPVQVAERLREALMTAGTVIVDCVTIWISNLILADESFGERDAAAKAEELARAARGSRSGVIVVTNEVGSGVVPDNALARRFRDCAGRANQVLARFAHEVHLCVCGIPITVKREQEGE
ncbi:MAG TPA: bifunctional adenosylcobinamide kinase/adenosylcobinamide-phosphate guanylyltransferase [Spirochaetia bacterium]|nr:bifunctional adenosylcobinamide kinase/adenosylcobinamide-phosphate guanylyltransferase [Spirochaetia bacterium]